MKRGPAIVLIGFMGAGKSTVGHNLATRIALPRYDTDELVGTRAGLTIAEIFARHGEAGFRDLETEALAQIPAQAAIIITGGGIILRPANVQRLRSLGVVINLTAEEEMLFGRASRDGSRPLLATANPRATFAELFRTRDPLYRAAADFTLDVSRLTPEEVSEAILKQVATLR